MYLSRILYWCAIHARKKKKKNPTGVISHREKSTTQRDGAEAMENNMPRDLRS